MTAMTFAVAVHPAVVPRPRVLRLVRASLAAVRPIVVRPAAVPSPVVRPR